MDLDRLRDVEVRNALEKGFERDPGLETGQGSAKAEVVPPTEGDVTGGVAVDVEAIWVWKDRLVSIRSREERHHHGPLGDGHTTDLGVLGREPHQ